MLLLALVLTLLQSVGGFQDAVRPSFLVIRADQLRASSIGAYGDTLATTPYIDQLAAEGTRYENAYSTSPVCSAHRTVFDNGRHPHANANYTKLHINDRTLHLLLQSAGWYTFHVGKHHKQPQDCISPAGKPQMVPVCGLRGLDYHAGHVQKHELIGSVYYRNGGGPGIPAGPWRPQAYVDEVITQLVQAANTNQRFYGVLDLEPPHSPYAEINGTVWDIYQAGDITAPPNVPAGSQAVAEGQLANYYGMVHSVDDMVGQVMAALENTGLASRTMVIFTSDHGSHMGAHGFTSQSSQKRSMYTEAIKVPVIVWEEGMTPTVDHGLFGTVDFKPLILQRAGLNTPSTLHGFRHPTDGLYLVQWDSGNTPDGAWRGVVRSDGMKYARSENSGPWVLFDTVTDPFELTNLIGLGDPREAEMEALLQEAAANVGEVLTF